MVIGLLVIALLPMLMEYSLVGELNHEIIGVSMAALFISRLILNRKWFLKAGIILRESSRQSSTAF